MRKFPPSTFDLSLRAIHVRYYDFDGNVRQASAHEAGSWKAAREKQAETAVLFPPSW